MRQRFFPILLITLFAMLLMANSFHRHTSLAAMAKCQTCSGMHASASTHSSIKTPHVIQTEITALPPAPNNHPLVQNSVTDSTRDRAPPAASA